LHYAFEITDRRRAEEALKQSEAKYRALVETTQTGYGIIDSQGTVLDANTEYAKLTGHQRPEQVIGKNVLEWTAAHDRERNIAELGKCAAQGFVRNLEVDYVNREGRIIPVEINATYVQTGDGDRILALVNDISDRKRVEELLKQSEEKFRLTFEKAPIGIMRYDQTSTITDCNEKFTEIIGAPQEKLLGFNMIRQLQDDRMREAMLASLNGEVGYYEGDYLSVTGGKLTSVKQIFEPIFSPEGVMSGGIAIVEDITKRKRAEEALRESEKRFRHISSTISDISYSCTVATDGSFYIDWIMGAAERITGYSLEEIKAKRCWRFLVIEEDLPLFQKHVSGLTVGSSGTCELRLRHKNGGVIWVASFAECVKEPGPSGCLYLYGGLVDISDRKQAVEEIYQKSEQLRALAARLSEIQEIERQNLARELHDQVCQNLASINIVLKTLMIRAQREPIEQLLSRLADLGAIAEQTGEVTRNIMEGLRPTVLDHYGLMKGLRQLGRQFSQLTGIDVEVHGEEADPRLTPEVELALFRIAQEALNNAAKHARPSQIVVTKEVNQDSVRLVIADNGTGFAPNLVHQPKDGRGWGLMTMTERATAVGGHCHIESQPDQGTRVVVEVPR